MPTKKRPAVAKGTPRLKNYSARAEDASIFDAIRQSLASHQAKRISFDYDEQGRATEIQFRIQVSSVSLDFKLPARLENVAILVQQSYRNAGRSISGEALEAQAYKTAWANIRDWVQAQMAIIDAGMVKTEEVFLPYLLIDENKTFFESFVEQRLLPRPHPDHVTITEDRE